MCMMLYTLRHVLFGWHAGVLRPAQRRMIWDQKLVGHARPRAATPSGDAGVPPALQGLKDRVRADVRWAYSNGRADIASSALGRRVPEGGVSDAVAADAAGELHFDVQLCTLKDTVAQQALDLLQQWERARNVLLTELGLDRIEGAHHIVQLLMSAEPGLQQCGREALTELNNTTASPNQLERAQHLNRQLQNCLQRCGKAAAHIRSVLGAASSAFATAEQQVEQQVAHGALQLPTLAALARVHVATADCLAAAVDCELEYAANAAKALMHLARGCGGVTSTARVAYDEARAKYWEAKADPLWRALGGELSYSSYYSSDMLLVHGVREEVVEDGSALAVELEAMGPRKPDIWYGGRDSR